METTLTTFDRAVIEKELPHKSAKDIAFLIDADTADVAAYIKAFCGDTITSFQQQLDDKKKNRTPKVKKEKPVISSRLKPSEVMRPNEGRIPLKRNEKVLKIKEVDYSQLQLVRIDSRTQIYCKPGESPEEAKHRYYTSLAARDKNGFSKLQKQAV